MPCYVPPVTTPDRVVRVRHADADPRCQSSEAERIGLMLSLEGVEQFGYETWPARDFWELGMRMAGLTWNRRNPFADGAAEDAGLSRLGRTLVDRFVLRARGRRSISPMPPAVPSPRSLARVGRRTGRVLCMQAAARSTTHPRNLDDDQMRELAARGGLLGPTLAPACDRAREPDDRPRDRPSGARRRGDGHRPGLPGATSRPGSGRYCLSSRLPQTG